MDESSFRKLAFARLRTWGERRAQDLVAIGWSGVSATEKMRQRAHGGGASTAPGELTVVELHCDTRGKTLQTELAVRALPPEQRAAVTAKFLEDRTMSVWASEQHIPNSTAANRVSAGVLMVGRLLHKWQRRDEPGAALPQTKVA